MIPLGILYYSKYRDKGTNRDLQDLGPTKEQVPSAFHDFDQR